MKCPNCGGDASPDQVRCTWCQGSLATVACPSCFATIFTGMKHCPWCGAEVAKAEPLKQIAGACPHCQTTMTFVQLGAGELSECRSCGGVWVSRDSFEKICQDRERQEAVLGRPVAEIVAPEATGKRRRVYVPCPTCKKLMNRMNFAGCSGVVIDWCREHGTWLDHTELPQIIAFIRGGGLRKVAIGRRQCFRTRRADSRRRSFTWPQWKASCLETHQPFPGTMTPTPSWTCLPPCGRA